MRSFSLQVVFLFLMLVSLTIRNYALIRALEIRPSAHLNVVTGETGAGKSMMA